MKKNRNIYTLINAQRPAKIQPIDAGIDSIENVMNESINALAVFSSLFLVLASVTGTLLAVDAIQEKIPSHRVENFEKITLGETLPVLRKTYPEITELSVDHNQFVSLQGIDQKDNDVNAYIDPRTGKIVGTPIKKGAFIQWTTALHRTGPASPLAFIFRNNRLQKPSDWLRITEKGEKGF